MTGIQGEIQVRRDTSANWASANPLLGLGEPGFDSTVNRFKVGDGSTAWKALGWATDTPLIPPPSTGWSALNSGSVTDSTDSRMITLASAAGDSWKGEIRTLTPASSYTATMYFEWGSPGISINGAGIVLRNSSSTSMVTYAGYFEAGLGNWLLRATKWTNATTFSADYVVKAVTLFSNGIPNWLRVRDDATTRFLEYSNNNVDWTLFHSVVRTDFITPDQIGWAVNSNNSGGSYTAVARLRHFSGVS